MATGVTMVTDLLRQFGGLHLTQGAITQTAGTIDQVGTIAAAATVFGPIGSEFLAAYAGAQANHVRALAQLTSVYEGIGAAAQSGATDYDLSEADSAASFTTQGLDASSLVSSSGSSSASSVSAASSSDSQLMSDASELLQVASQGVGLATSTAGQLATAGQQAVATAQAAANQHTAMANRQADMANQPVAGRAGTMPGAMAAARPADGTAYTHSPVAAPAQSPAAAPDQSASTSVNQSASAAAQVDANSVEPA